MERHKLKSENYINLSWFRVIAKTEGVVIRTQDFKEYDLILTAFCADVGIKKFFIKGGSNRKKQWGETPAPLNRCEFVFSEKNRELETCRETFILSRYTKLAKDFETLSAACSMVSALAKTQLPGKPAPLLYALLTTYLDALEGDCNPFSLSSSFLLKLLRHEGAWGVTASCSDCNKPQQSLYLKEGEGFCETHAPAHSLFFTEEEAHLLSRLLYSRSLSSISSCRISKPLQEKIQQLLPLIGL